MRRRIKKKYTLIVVSSVAAVIILIVAAINLTNFSSINTLLDEKLTMLVENDGLIPEVNFGPPPEEDPPKQPDEPTDGGEEGSGTNPDDPGQTEGNPDDPVTAPDNSQGEDGSTEGSEEDGENSENNGEEEDKKEDDKQEESYHHMSPETPFELRYFSVKLDTHGGVLDVYTDKIAAVNDTRAIQYANDVFRSEKQKGFVDSYRYMSGVTEDGNLIFVFLDANRELKSVNVFLASSMLITALGVVMVLVLVLLLSGRALKPIIESYEKQKRFITDAGHEMKTPLTIISANAEIIEMENGESQWSDGIKKQISKLTSLIEKLVILSKLEEEIKLEMGEFSISEAFYSTCEQYKSMAVSKNVRFDLAISENVKAVGNENEIRRCITLLLDNAFRYVNEGGFISVKAQGLINGVELRFSNSTNGVEKGSLDVWFDRFYRTDTSRNSDTGGSGIGLSVVKAIVLAHGGTVKAFSNDGKTVEFVINL